MKKERDIISNLLTGTISFSDYLSECDSAHTSKILPAEQQIIMEFLNIRRNTFVKATPRKASDYVKYDKPVDPATEFYPVHKLLNYPKHYEVSKQTDRDFCEKISLTVCSALVSIICIAKA